jgi:hypothetical protein
MLLIRNRIWGNIIGGVHRSGTKIKLNSISIFLGYKELKKPLMGPARAKYYEFADLKHMYPFIDKWDEINDKKLKY